jgi:TRAP-type C4-dicarboxylate transport system substrate-binding protein
MRPLVIAAAIVALAQPAAAKKVTIKLGTMAPSGSSWHRLLKEMGNRWAEVSNGQVRLKVYAGGVVGNEEDMMRKMRIGQLHAVAVTSVGLKEITRAPQSISAPGLIADDNEWHHVFEKMRPAWNQQVEKRGYKVLAWADLGWVYMFVRDPIQSPADMQGSKVFAWAGDPKAVESWRAAGFRPVVLSATDVTQGLSTGMIDGYAATPLMAMTARWFEHTPYMVKTAWGHLPGATVVSQKAWAKIPAELQPRLLAVAGEFAARVDAEVLRMQEEAVAAMRKRGLQMVDLDKAGQRTWNEMAEKAWPVIRGGVVEAADFDATLAARDSYRAGK